jgi:group I intron endonuclease
MCHHHQKGDGGASGKAKTGVYYAWHAETRRIYIGSALNTSKRAQRHISDSRNGRMTFFARKLRELGVESFTWGVIELCEKSDRLVREERWIEAFDATGRNGFNTRKHPTKGSSYEIDESTRRRLSESRLGKKQTPEHRKNVGDAIRGLKRTPETIAKMRAAHLGKTHSLETREKISRVQIGRVVSAHTRAKIGAFWKGKRHSDEAKAKMRAAHLGKTLADEHRAKLSLSHLGKKQSAETCQKRLNTWAMKRKTTHFATEQL